MHRSLRRNFTEKNFLFFFLFQCEKSSTRRVILSVWNFLFFVSFCVDNVTNAICIPENLHIHFGNEI